jgi:hypothetical protein
MRSNHANIFAVNLAKLMLTGTHRYGHPLGCPGGMHRSAFDRHHKASLLVRAFRRPNHVTMLRSLRRILLMMKPDGVFGKHNSNDGCLST